MLNDRETESHAQFNMSLATLQRIDWLLKQIESPESNLMVVRNAIIHLYKEAYPFLSEQERSFSKKIYDSVVGGLWADNDTPYKYYYSDKGMAAIEELDFWLRDKLNEKGLLMAQSDDPNSALGR